MRVLWGQRVLTATSGGRGERKEEEEEVEEEGKRGDREEERGRNRKKMEKEEGEKKEGKKEEVRMWESHRKVETALAGRIYRDPNSCLWLFNEIKNDFSFASGFLPCR